ncbi:MAG: hypothetical protein HC777_00790 [Hyphomonadaceae bacterium]|nr:hypothetical protein [Hyphomonadaceae bacterium]
MPTLTFSDFLIPAKSSENLLRIDSAAKLICSFSTSQQFDQSATSQNRGNVITFSAF